MYGFDGRIKLPTWADQGAALKECVNLGKASMLMTAQWCALPIGKLKMIPSATEIGYSDPTRRALAKNIDRSRNRPQASSRQLRTLLQP
jgi:hypothetical protein